MNWLRYLLEANIYLAVFYLLYYILLDKETYYKLNRVYLLSACIIAYVIPVVQIGILRPAELSSQVIQTVNNMVFKPVAIAAAPIDHFTWQYLLVYGYIAGTVVMLCLFIFKLLGVLMLIRTSENSPCGRYKIIRLEDSDTAFSFFRCIFIGNKASGASTIIRHEQVHINQKHTYDIVFLELIKIISWFNPFVYLLQRGLRAVHEYVADQETAAFENDAISYSSFLLNNAYGLSGPIITNSFFNYNLLKKRIIMLNKKRSGNLARLKYLVALPVCAALLCTSTIGFSKTYGWIDVAPANTSLVNKTVKGDTVYSVVQTAPEFPGGMHAFLTYVAKNVKYPASARANKIEGRVIVSFVIEKNGEISGVKLAKSVSPDLDKEALRVVSSFPKWKPGAQGGKPVRTAFAIPISFKLPPR